MAELKERGLLDSTLIVWMGEFGRTPKINGNTRTRPLSQRLVHGAGRRRHQRRSGRRPHQRRRHHGRRPARLPCPTCWRPCSARWSVDPMKQNISNVGRPIRLVDPSAKPIEEIVG